VFGGTQDYNQTFSAVAANRSTENLNRRQFVPTRVVGLGGQWVRPLEMAVVAAPGLDFASAELGRRYLVRWGALTPEQRRAGQESLRLALRSESFLRAAFSTAVATLGAEAAVGALSDDSPTLRLAEQVSREAGNGAAADLIAARLRALSASAPASRPSP